LPENGIQIELSKAQVNQVVREAAKDEGLLGVLGYGLRDRDIRGMGSSMDDTRFSRSLLRALMVLASYPPDGTPRSVSDVAKELGMGISTAHRYTATFAEVGVLERDAVSRQYRHARNGQSAAAA
jgi:IclR helix-turn-helix domain